MGKLVVPSSTLATLAVAVVFPGMAAVRAQDASQQGSKRHTERAAIDSTKPSGSEDYVRQGLRKAEQLSTSDVGQAREVLRTTLDRLRDDPSAPPKRREAWVRMLQDRIRMLEVESGQERSVSDDRALAAAATAYRREEERNRQRADETIKRLLDGVHELQRRGRTGEAGRRAAQMAEQYRSTPAVQASNRIASTIDQLESNRQLQGDRGGQVVSVLTQVDKASRLPKDDIEFPKDWKEKTKARGKKSQLTEKERSILRALDSRISVRFQNTPLNDVIEYLQTYLGQPIVVDMAALKQAEIPYDSPVTANLKKLSVRTVLRAVLADVGLTYTIRDDAIEITTPQRARETVVTRVYYVGDLLGDVPELRAFWAVHLIDLIQSTVDPQSWQRNGGAGTIYYHPITNSIIVKQGVEGQAVISDTIR